MQRLVSGKLAYVAEWQRTMVVGVGRGVRDWEGFPPGWDVVTEALSLGGGGGGGTHHGFGYPLQNRP